MITLGWILTLGFWGVLGAATAYAWRTSDTAEDFPPGTKLIVTARIELPAADPDEGETVDEYDEVDS